MKISKNTLLAKHNTRISLNREKSTIGNLSAPQPLKMPRNVL